MEKESDSALVKTEKEVPHTVKESPEPFELSGNGNDPKNLGNGRWKHQGKTYKEEPIGKS